MDGEQLWKVMYFSCSNTAIENRVPFGGVEKSSGALAQIYLTFGPLYEAIQASTDGKTAWVRDFQSMLPVGLQSCISRYIFS